MKVNFILPSTKADSDELQDCINTIHSHIIITKINELDINYDNKIKLYEQIRSRMLHTVEKQSTYIF